MENFLKKTSKELFLTKTYPPTSMFSLTSSWEEDENLTIENKTTEKYKKYFSYFIQIILKYLERKPINRIDDEILSIIILSNGIEKIEEIEEIYSQKNKKEIISKIIELIYNWLKSEPEEIEKILENITKNDLSDSYNDYFSKNKDYIELIPDESISLSPISYENKYPIFLLELLFNNLITNSELFENEEIEEMINNILKRYSPQLIFYALKKIKTKKIEELNMYSEELRKKIKELNKHANDEIINNIIDIVDDCVITDVEIDTITKFLDLFNNYTTGKYNPKEIKEKIISYLRRSEFYLTIILTNDKEYKLKLAELYFYLQK